MVYLKYNSKKKYNTIHIFHCFFLIVNNIIFRISINYIITLIN